MYPANAKVTFDSNESILIMTITGEGKGLKIYINTGKKSSEYLVNPGSSYNSTPVKMIGYTSGAPGTNIGSSTPGILAYQEN